jgi:hypothetical protein
MNRQAHAGNQLSSQAQNILFLYIHENSRLRYLRLPGMDDDDRGRPLFVGDHETSPQSSRIGRIERSPHNTGITGCVCSLDDSAQILVRSDGKLQVQSSFLSFSSCSSRSTLYPSVSCKMYYWLLFLGALLPLPIQALHTAALTVSPAQSSSIPVLPSFVSFSIEFAFFPDFAGNSSAPNTFSLNLLNNLGRIQGSNPIIRVGGNTQDYALYDASLPVATYGIYNYKRSRDYPTTLTIGPSYFDSYSTWPNTTFSHGFSLAKNGSVGLSSLLATVPLACKALEGGKLAYWELGNEPDLYKTSAQGVVRPASWNEQAYVDEWLGKSRAIKAAMAQTCPDLVNAKWIAPSFGGTSNSLDPIITWQDGLDTDNDIALISSHK